MCKCDVFSEDSKKNKRGQKKIPHLLSGEHNVADLHAMVGEVGGHLSAVNLRHRLVCRDTVAAAATATTRLLITRQQQQHKECVCVCPLNECPLREPSNFYCQGVAYPWATDERRLLSKPSVPSVKVTPKSRDISKSTSLVRNFAYPRNPKRFPPASSGRHSTRKSNTNIAYRFHEMIRQATFHAKSQQSKGVIPTQSAKAILRCTRRR